MANVIEIDHPPAVLVEGGGVFPVRRIFCVGKNYAKHVVEMGGDPKSGLPVFFTKPADAIHLGGTIKFPLATTNLHYEAELVVALKSGGENIAPEEAGRHIFGYAAGCDLTRRDLQHKCKDAKAPWDIAKALDDGAVIGPITRDETVRGAGAIQLSVNGETKQDSDLSNLIWTIPEIIASLSTFFELKAGDLIYTGTPEGVGSINIGDQVRIEIDATTPVEFNLVSRP